MFGDANRINTQLEMYRSIKPEEIREVARKYLNPNQRLYLQYVPESEKPVEVIEEAPVIEAPKVETPAPVDNKKKSKKVKKEKKSKTK